jgi:hydroxymethylpyrimidine/phosphomethylpyrimidine kinase
MRKPRQTPVVMTIAGSDSGGGAGIQADLKTFQALGVFGTSAITCLTAQNPDEVTRVAAVAPGMVAEQIRAICRGFPVKAAKTGMLYSAEIIRAVARAVRKHRIPVLVVDPVMIATSGARLLRQDAVEALCRQLIPLATVVTPNLPEAEVLLGRPIRSLAELKAAARGIGERFGVACVCKGGHLGEEARVQGSGFRKKRVEVADVLWVKGRTHVFRSERVKARETHGTGCTFSAALAAFLAKGTPLPQAVRKAKEFVGEALKNAVRAGKHWPLGVGKGGRSFCG